MLADLAAALSVGLEKPRNAVRAEWTRLVPMIVAGGPPYAIYLSQRGLSKEQFRATLGFATLTSISLRLMAFVLTGLLLDREVWLKALAVVPACLLGIWGARKIFLRISRDALMRLEVACVIRGQGHNSFYVFAP